MWCIQFHVGKVKEAIYINAVNPTNGMDKKRILNLEKVYDLMRYGVNLMECTDNLCRGNVGLQVDILIGSFFRYLLFQLLIGVSRMCLWSMEVW